MKGNIEVLILIGSKSDISEAENVEEMLKKFGVKSEVKVVSAHRTPELVAEIAERAEKESVKVIIAAAGLANHLAGAVASRTLLPVIGLPLARAPLMGIDSLLSVVQMPSGVPVASVGIGAAKNAAVFAVEILALSNEKLKQKLIDYRNKMKMEAQE